MDPGSATTSPCDRDRVELISASSSTGRPGPLCGDNSGQHVYLAVQEEGSSSPPPMIRVITAARMGVGSGGVANLTQPYSFNIKATQIDCRGGELAALRGD